MSAHTMPFGKYRGTPIRDLDDGYLAWLGERDLRDPLRTAVRAEIAHRSRAPLDERRTRNSQEPRDQRGPNRAVCEALIAAGHAELIRRCEGVGEAGAQFPAVSDAANWLRAQASTLP